MSKITKRADGRYCIKYKGIFFYGKTEAEVRKKRDQYIKDEDKPVVKQITALEYSSAWLPVAKADVANRTYNAYAADLDQFNKLFGCKSLSTIKPLDVKEYLNLYKDKS